MQRTPAWTPPCGTDCRKRLSEMPLRVISPFDKGYRFTEVPYHTGPAIEARIDATRATHWRSQPLENRCQIVRRRNASVRQSRSASTREISLQMGKPLEAQGELRTFFTALTRRSRMRPPHWPRM